MLMPRRLTILALLVLGLAPATHSQCERAQVFPSDGTDIDRFGSAIAVAEGTMLVGAHFNNEFGSNAGAAYVYTRQSDGSWQEVTKLTSSDAAADDRFGFSVDLWRGTTAVVGARYNDDIGYGSGAIYVFKRQGGSWPQEAKLVANDEQVGSLFGAAVAVHATTIVSGASDDANAGINAGSAYVFSDLGAGWVQTNKLIPSDASNDDRFGSALDVHANTIVVGAYGVDDPLVGSATGAVYIYEKQAGAWTEVQKIVSDSPVPGALFGQRVQVEGKTLVAGSVFDTGNEPFTGAAYVFERQPDGTWTQAAKLVADDGIDGDMFGSSVAIAGDTILCGAWATDGSIGTVYVYKRLASGWTQISSFQASGSFSQVEHFGFAMAYDGDHAAVGARQGNNPSSLKTGSAYVVSNVGKVFPYGKPCAGAGGFAPSLTAVGCPSPGGNFSLKVEGGLGNSGAFFFFGWSQAAIPFGPPGCTFNVQPILNTMFFVPTDGIGPGDGTCRLDLVIPANAPTLDIVTQAWVLDSSVKFSGASGTNGLQISIE